MSFSLTPALSRKQGATEIYLIRHGDALPEPEDVTTGGGYDDQPLSRLGKAQAEAAADWLTEVHFDAIYSSPLRRAMETAQPLAMRRNLEIRPEYNLREVKLTVDVPTPDPGNDPTVTSSLLRERMAEIMRRIIEGGKWSALPGSESSESLRGRAIAMMTELARRHPGERIVAYSHGGYINATMSEMLGLEKDFFFLIPNTSISVIRWQGNNGAIFQVNQTSHLRELMPELDL